MLILSMQNCHSSATSTWSYCNTAEILKYLAIKFNSDVPLLNICDNTAEILKYWAIKFNSDVPLLNICDKCKGCILKAKTASFPLMH